MRALVRQSSLHLVVIGPRADIGGLCAPSISRVVANRCAIALVAPVMGRFSILDWQIARRRLSSQCLSLAAVWPSGLEAIRRPDCRCCCCCCCRPHYWLATRFGFQRVRGGCRRLVVIDARGQCDCVAFSFSAEALEYQSTSLFPSISFCAIIKRLNGASSKLRE